MKFFVIVFCIIEMKKNMLKKMEKDRGNSKFCIEGFSLFKQLIHYFCIKNYQMGCQEKKLTDFSYFLLLNSLRECNVNTYEFGKKTEEIRNF